MLVFTCGWYQTPLLDHDIHAIVLQTGNPNPLGERVDVDNDLPWQVPVRLQFRDDFLRIQPSIKALLDQFAVSRQTSEPKLFTPFLYWE